MNKNLPQYFNASNLLVFTIFQQSYFLTSDKGPEWDDPELHQDIQAATGIDLSRKGKGHGKGKKKKYPNLTDIKKLTNTNKRRLKSKVLNR